MEIKEKDEQHKVFEVTRDGSSLILILVFYIVWILLVQFIPVIWVRVLLSLFTVYGILHILLELLVGNRIVLDKPTQTVTIREPSPLLVRKQRVVPFSNVSSVVIDYERWLAGGGAAVVIWHVDVWKVSLDIGEKFEIAHTVNEANMLHLANEISRFIGRELVDNSAKPEV